SEPCLRYARFTRLAGIVTLNAQFGLARRTFSVNTGGCMACTRQRLFDLFETICSWPPTSGRRVPSWQNAVGGLTLRSMRRAWRGQVRFLLDNLTGDALALG